MMSLNSTVVVSEGQVSSELGNEVAILDFREGTYYGLDSVGARIWSLIQEPKAVTEIRDTLVNEYEVEPERCERDLLALLQNLADRGLVKIAGRAST